MKLIFCTDCNQILSMNSENLSICPCGKSSGMYEEDGRNVKVRGPVVVLGISNSSFMKALKSFTFGEKDSYKMVFESFIIPNEDSTIKELFYMQISKSKAPTKKA